MTVPGRSSSVCLSSTTERYKSMLHTSKSWANPHTPLPIPALPQGWKMWVVKHFTKPTEERMCMLGQELFCMNFLHNTNVNFQCILN